VSAGLLVCLLASGRLQTSAPEGHEAYISSVTRAIDDVPYRINGWTGSDLTTAPPQAVEMLRPSRVLHRGYSDAATGESIRLVIVHCPDVRDMAGHHPPNCYPATGWVSEGQGAAGEIEVGIRDRRERMALHTFSHMDKTGARRLVTIASGFLAPGSRGLIPEMSGLRRVSENRRDRRLGAAQVQMIFDGGASPEEAITAVEAFAPGLTAVFDRVTEGLP
jgi:hypothetical protein